MKRILFYTDTPLLGGAENQMFLLAKFLPKGKYQVSIACGCYQRLNPWCQKFMELGINVIRLKVLHKHDPRHFFYLKKLLPSFDIFHMHLWNPASCRYGFLANSGIPIVITEHDPFPLGKVKAWIKQKLVRRVKKIIVASKAAANIVITGDPGTKSLISIIPNGIDIDEWRREAELPNRNEFRRLHFKTMPNEKIILCVAELHARKGQKYLIAAMRELLQASPNIKLVFVGEGPKRPHYEKLAAQFGDRVLFLGWRKDTAELMAAADIFVLPSIREAFGLVLLEAGSLALPIVATAVGGIPEIIEDSKTGILVEPGNAQTLAQGILKFFQNPEDAKRLGHAAREKTEMLFGAKTMAERTAEVYDSVLI